MKESNIDKVTCLLVFAYLLLPNLFFFFWWMFSSIISKAFPKLNGEPFEAIGSLYGFFPAYFTMIFIYKLFSFLLVKFMKKIKHESS